MPALTTNWVVPYPKAADKVMSQLVLNAGEQQTTQAGDNQNSRLTELLRMQVARVRGAIIAASRIPLSQTDGSVPPEAEMHVLVLAVDAATASTPNLQNVVVNPMGGMYAPFKDLVRRAEDWLESVEGGQTFTYPTDPVQTGDRTELAPFGTVYPGSGQLTVGGLTPGLTYFFKPGANDSSLTCGATTLNAAGTFTATTNTALVSGTASQACTASVQLSVDDRNTTNGGDVVGSVDMSTD